MYGPRGGLLGGPSMLPALGCLVVFFAKMLLHMLMLFCLSYGMDVDKMLLHMLMRQAE